MAEAHQEHLTKEQKTGFVFLLVFGLAILGLGFLQMRNTIYNPFAPNVDRVVEAPTQDDAAAALQALDTDQDGLNNYEELNFYETSPYLPDTDSDGLTDKEEIDAGTDPLCPEGQNCDQGTGQGQGSTTTIRNVTGGIVPDSNVDVFGQVGVGAGSGQQQEIDDIMAMRGDAAQIRELLRSTGQIPESQLEDISDAMLINLFEDLLTDEDVIEENLPEELLPETEEELSGEQEVSEL